MKLKFEIILLFLSTICYAHKDKVIKENYGNVKIYMKTGFDYSEINKIMIIGKLSEKISNQLKYRDTIMIEYIHDYTKEYLDDLYMLEYNNSSNKLMFGVNSNYTIKTNKSGLAIRVHAKNINIVDILKLVEFTIINKETTNNHLVIKQMKFKNEIYEYEEGQREEVKTHINSIATNDKLIKKIISENSELIKTIISDKIEVEKQSHFGIEIYWQNDKFIFEYKLGIHDQNVVVFEIKDFYYYVEPNPNDLFIFINENSFYFLDGSNQKEKKLSHIENGSYMPVMVRQFDNKILIFDNRKSFNVFLPKKNKTITKFE